MSLATRFTILAFGVTSFIAGFACLADPAKAVLSLDMPLTSIPSMKGNGLAAIAMGLYYSLATYQNNVAFFAATVPMRMLTATVFWSQGWTSAALWEGGGSLATAITMLWTYHRGTLDKTPGKKL